MTTLSLDGFAHYGGGTALMLSGVYANLGNANNLRIGTPTWDTTGSIMLGCDPNAGAGFAYGPKRLLASSKSALVVACRFAIDVLPLISASVLIHAAYDGSGNLITWLGCDTSGILTLYNASNTALISTTSQITAGAIHHLEFKYIFGAGGSCGFILRMDDLTGTGTPAISSSTLTFSQTGNIASYRILGQQLGASTGSEWITELIIRDTSGTVNNGFAGSQYHVGTLPTTNATPIEFPTTVADTINFKKPLSIVTAISAVDFIYLGDRGTGSATVKSSLVGATGATTDGTLNSFTTTPTFYHDIYETDPSTSGPISPSTIVNGSGLLTRTT